MHETGPIICPNCGARVPREFQFCGRCGRRLSASAETPSAERRQITVMFCDLVGSVSLSRLLDPEDFAAVVHRYQEACVGIIEAHGGYVAQYLGDGILAYFGYPSAGERVAEQAVRAGLESLERVAALGNELMQDYGLALSMRIGIHTGLVIVDEFGSGAHRERLALGETPNLAARLQSLAPTDTLVVSRETYRLIEDTFRCVDLGPHAVKGVGRPQPIYQVVEERHDGGLMDRWEMSEAPGMVGREDHVAHLMSEWSEATAGRGRAVLIAGEPGIGKSHLTQHFRGRIGADSHYGIVCRCAPNLEHSAFHPLVDWLARVLNFYPEQPSAERLEMLRFVADRTGMADRDVVPLLGALLTKTPPSDAADLGYSASRARSRTEAVLEELVLSMESERPLLFIVEDVQWIDPSTRDFLVRFAEKIPSRPILLLMTARSVPAFDWPAGLPLSRIEVEQLEGRQIKAVIAGAAGGRSLPDQVVDRILQKADGVPLYAQEFTKMVIESGMLEEDETGFRLRQDIPELAIPSTLQDSLMARLDRLMPVKVVAQVCSVFGRSFPLDLAAAAASMPEVTLKPALERLVEADLLVKDGTPPREHYVFRHALLQEAAYESILKSRRAVYHRRIARHLIEHDDSESARTETIAHHLTRAGETEQAAAYWCRAGEEAQRRWSNDEAVEYFKSGLTLLEQLAPAEERRRTAFHLNVGLAGACLQQKGYTHPDVVSAFERAAVLASDLKDATASIPPVLGLWSHYTVLAEHTRAEVLAERLSKLAQLEPEPLNAFSALGTRAFTWFWQGDIGTARKRIESLLVRFGDLRAPASPGLSFQHPLIGALSYLSLILWCQGEAGRAVGTGREAVRTADQIGHPFSLAFACGFNSMLHTYMGEVDAVREMAGRTVDLSERYGFPFWHSVGSIVRSWSEGADDPERAANGMRHGLESLKQAGVRIWTAYPTVLMAELLGRIGRTDAAMDELDAVLSECELHGEYYFMPETRRLRARLLDASGENEQADREREYALKMARRQTATALVLRILNDVMRYDADPSPTLEALLRSTVESLTDHHASPDVDVAMQLLNGSIESRQSTSGRA